MPTYRIKGWERFQHYKDRSPPWIRLHRSLLDDYEYHCLPDASKALAPFLWLLASENKDPASGAIDSSDEKIAFRLHMQLKRFQDAIRPLIDNGFISVEHDASSPLAPCVHSATPETDSTETEEEREKRGRVKLNELSVDHIADWLALKRTQGRYLHHDEHFIVEYFKDYCKSKGKKYADYIAGCRGAFEWASCQPKPRTTQQNGHSGSDKPTKADRSKAAVVIGLQSHFAETQLQPGGTEAIGPGTA